MEVAVGKSLLEVLRTVALDADEQSAFQADPSGYLGEHGYEDVPADDLTEAVGLMADTLPPEAAEAVGPTGDLTGTGTEGGASWVDALQRLDDPSGPSNPPEAMPEATSTTFGDVDFDNSSHGAADSEAESPPSEPEDVPDSDVSEADPADAVDFGAGSATPAFEEAPPSPDAEAVNDTDAPDGELDFGGLSEPVGLDDPSSDQPLELADDDAFNAAEDFADQLQQDADDADLDIDDLDIGSF